MVKYVVAFVGYGTGLDRELREVGEECKGPTGTVRGLVGDTWMLYWTYAE